MSRGVGAPRRSNSVRASRARRALDALDRLGRRPWFSYLMLVLLQIKVLWGMWRYRDMFAGDESGYYNRAFLWFKDAAVDLVWSPLYTAFFGTLMHLSTDAYVVTILQRIVVVLLLDVMILALMRRLLPHWIAWLIAAWWAILPINFDTASTVHLFAVIPVLAAWLLALGRARWMHGAALAVFVVTTVLVRNEYLVATIAFLLMCIWWEGRMPRSREGMPRGPLPAYAIGYGVPLLLAVALVLFFYARSVDRLPELWSGRALATYRAPWSMLGGLRPKHVYNMCQVYAFGYQQRHPEWIADPMLDCAPLMERTFGAPLPSLIEMMRNNPVDTLRHFWWNVGLTPSGIQLLLFDASAGRTNPDYVPARLGSVTALWLSLVAGAILVVGGVLLYRDRRFWWQEWLQDRALGWLAMLSVVAVAALIIPTQRPRPSYLFCQSIVVMALIGMCVFAIARRWPVLGKLSRYLAAVMIGLLLVVPPHYLTRAEGRPLRALYERLAPFGGAFNRPDTIFLVSAYPLEVHGYVGHNAFTSPLVNFDYAILDRASPQRSVASLLEEHGVTLFYVDDALWRRLWANPTDRGFLMSPGAAGWRVLASQHTRQFDWALLEKERPRASP